MAVSWAPDYAGGVLETGWNRPFNDGRLLGIDPVTGKFLLLNEKHPEYVITLNPDGTQVQIGWSKVKVPVDPTAFGSRGGHCKPRFTWVKVWTPPSDLVWFLTNDPGDGRPVPGKHRSCAPVLFTDGDDALFGQDGRDWLVGGTGEDALWGGADSDLLNGDDDPWTDLGLNKHRDKADSYEDELIGGRGDDDYITNNSHDHITHGDGDLDPTALPSGSFARWPVLRQVPEEMEDTLKAMTRALGPQVVAVPFTDPVPEQLAAPTNGEVPLTWSPTFLEVPELAELGTPDRGKPGLGWGADDADEQLDCEDGGRAPACLLRVTTLLVTVGTTVTIPLSLQVVDVVENLAGRPGSQHDKGEGRGGHHDDGYRSAGADERHGGHGLGRVDEQPFSRENLAIVAVMAAGLSVLPVLEPVNQPASAAPVPSADPAAPVVQAAAWKPGPGEVDGWLDQGEPWAGSRAPAFVDLALLPWVTPVEIAVLVDVPPLGDGRDGDRCDDGKHARTGERGYELEKSLWLGSVPGPAVVGLALNWPVPWPPADQPAVAQPTGLGTASFVEFASLPWWLVPVATTLAVHGTTGDQHDSRDHKGRHGRDEGRHGRSGDRRDRPQTGGVLGLTPLLTNLNLAAQFAVEWSTVALLVDVDADQVDATRAAPRGIAVATTGRLWPRPSAVSSLSPASACRHCPASALNRCCPAVQRRSS